MSKIGRLFLSIAIAGSIYWLALFIIPSLSLFKELLESAWISKGNITQATYLVLSLILIAIFSQGNFAAYGFKPIRVNQLVKPVLIGIPIGLLVILLMIITTILSGFPADGDEPQALTGGILRTIISIWIIASIVEELFYRGLVQSLLAPLKDYGFKLFKLSISVPVTIPALLFGLGHFCLLSSMPGKMVINIVIAATVLGFTAGYFREKTGSLIPAIAVHMTFNIVGFTIPNLMMKLASG